MYSMDKALDAIARIFDNNNDDQHNYNVFVMYVDEAIPILLLLLED